MGVRPIATVPAPAAVLVLALLAVVAWSVPAHAGLLHGTVRASAGGSTQTLAGATVAAYDPLTATEVAQTTTAVDGSYALALADGTYAVEFRPPPGSVYGAARIDGVAVAGDTRLDQLLVIAGQLRFSGVLRTGDGLPVANVKVRLQPADGGAAGAVQTAADGSFTLATLPGGYRLQLDDGAGVAGVPRFQLLSDAFTLEQDTARDLALPAAVHQLAVRLQGPLGEPVTGAGVHVVVPPARFELAPGLWAGGPGGGELSGHGTTGAAGIMSMPLFASEAALSGGLVDAVDGYGTTRFMVPAIAADTVVDVPVPRRVTFAGTLRSGGGAVLPEIKVRLRPTTGGVPELVQTSADGAFSLTVTPGRYRLQLDGGGSAIPGLPHGFDLLTDAFDLDEDVIRDLTLPAAVHQLTVRVRGPYEEAVAGAPVVVVLPPARFELAPGLWAGGAGNGEISGRGTTDAKGTVSLPTFASEPSGIGLIDAVGGYGSASFAVPAIVADTTVDVTVPRDVRFSGVLRSGDGIVLPGVKVRLLSEWGAVVSEVTGPDGAFSLVATAGAYRLGLDSGAGGGGVPAFQLVSDSTFELAADTSRDLTLPADVHTLVLRVTGDGDAPLSGAVVALETQVAPFEVAPALAVSGWNGGYAITDAAGLAALPLFDTIARAGAGVVTPPAGSDYAPVRFDVPAVLGDMTLAILLLRPPPPNEAPVAALAAPASAFRDEPVTFDASGSRDPDGTIVRHEWDLDGDGGYETDTAASPTVQQAYATLGERTVRVRVTDDDGATAVASATLTVGSRPPVAALSFTPPFPRTATPVRFTSESADPDGTIVRHEWDIDGDGTYETDTGVDPTVVWRYAQPGARDVSLRVTDSDGASATATVPVTVRCTAPLPRFCLA